MSHPTVAVVIPFHSDDRFFPQAIASVLAQTHPPDEVVVVDDASPAGTNQSLLALDPRITVIRHDVNRGAGAARQTGTEATTSELIAYLDADDLWLPNKLERQLADFTARPELAAHHVGLVSFRSDGSEITYDAKPERLELSTELRRNEALPSAYLIRRTALTKVGGWRADNIVMEDWDLNIRVLAAGLQVGFLPEPLVRFRRTNHGNLSARGLRHMFINLRTIWAHRALYHRELGLRPTAAVVGRVVHDEGSRRGKASGLLLRGVGRLLGYPKAYQ